MITHITLPISDTRPRLAKIFVTELPMRRMGDRTNLKGACVYLLRYASRYHTGNDLLVTGEYKLDELEMTEEVLFI
jgi:sorbose reductase